ncbi:YncE family protein [Rubricoccus marinus]|uniref:Cell surface protein n=1 Tax=Rubricoccus marinus TaxID=716817 RepID=A0A259TV02_9BACT|nr:DUF5074 domain-containing protein [Rubricoccus marinus]OZC01526.1 hypothetical protein BSZ36_00110 [Rubricoccus marinus]
MPRLSRLALLLALPLALAACDSTDPEGNADVAGVYVLNQGAFGNDASGGVTVYDPETMTASALTAPGGLVQAGAIRDGKLYLLLNFSDSFSTGSGRVDIIDVATGATERQIDVGTPRGIAFVGGTAYVTNLYGASVTPIDLASGTAGTPIPVGENPEGIVASGDELFVANSGFGTGTTLSVISTSTSAVTETVELTCASPNEVIADADGDIWVVCNGTSDFSTGEVTEPGQVLAVNAASRGIVARFPSSGLLGGAALGQDAAFDAAAGFLYVIQSNPNADDAIFRFDTQLNAFEAESPVSGGDLSGVGFAGGRFYLARLDPDNPFSDNGTVSIQERSGNFAGSFDAGIVPAAFAVALD